MKIFSKYQWLLFLSSLLLVFQSCETQLKSWPQKEYINYVNPFIGTGFHGHTFPGPTMPHGQIQLSPDTHLLGWDSSSGYHYDDRFIYGFSQNHLSGTGIGDMGDLLILPYTGTFDNSVKSAFSHLREEAKVGYYKVDLLSSNVTAELTASERIGVHRYTFPKDSIAYVKIDLEHILQADWGHKVVDSYLEIIDDFTIKGFRKTSGWATNDPFWFEIKSDKPFDIISINGAIDSIDRYYKGNDLKAYLTFGKLEDPLQLKVAISYSSEKGANLNLSSENPADISFEETVNAAQHKWENQLSKVKIESFDSEIIENFYTALYHTKMAPMTFHDSDNTYRGLDQKLYVGERFNAYSLWDIYRSWLPLMTIISPKQVELWGNDLIAHAEEGGLLPKWPLNGNYTGTMIGYPAVAFFADALSKGLLIDQHDKILSASLKSAVWQPEFNKTHKGTRAENVMPIHLLLKDSLGFVPADLVKESVSYGLELSFYDWCISEIAKTKDSVVYAEFSEKSTYYKKYFDPKIKFMRGKKSNGSWEENFDPNFSDHLNSPFVEGNSWQWTPFVLHDPEGLRDLIGGAEAFRVWLDNLFSTTAEVTGENKSMDITGLIGQYAHGNEPSHHIPYLYQFTDQPWRTQEVLNTILFDFYKATPDGIIGNEDCGQMSAWYVLNTLGLYQITPGSPVFHLGRPLITSADISLEERNFSIVVKNNSKQNKYIQKASLNGIELESLQISYAEIMSGGQLLIEMGESPVTNN